jgi:hypothetical protein
MIPGEDPGERRAREGALQFLFAIAQGGTGPFFYRMAPPDQF